MRYISYKIGQERQPLTETKNYEDSVFLPQYRQALKQIESYLNSLDDASLKCVAFCGDRGEGKTSCMSSIVGILEKLDSKDSPAFKFVDSLKFNKLQSLKGKVIKMVDPSFFDEKHNILEIVIGQLYNSFLNEKNSENIELRNNVLDAFQKVKENLACLKGGGLKSFNELQQLTVLASSISLQESMENLIKSYLKYFKKDYLVIPIDDIDLEIPYAYKMSEQIRKFLSVPKCIVLFSFKIRQLQEGIALAISNSIGEQGNDDNGENNIFPSKRIMEMARKYVSKLIPVTCRVEMPKLYSLSETDLILPNTSKPNEPGKYPLKQLVVEMIYNRTRYLFYNPIDGVSPIIPNNMRDLIGLVGLLHSMPPIDDSRAKAIHESLLQNKNIFKYFFFNVWKNRFHVDLRDILDSMIKFDYGTSFNREVVNLLSRRFGPYLEKDYHLEQEESDDVPNSLSSNYQTSDTRSSSVSADATITVRSIVDSKNFGYNITVGDLFYIFSILESDTLSEEDFALEFFLKSLYSMKLYETYDLVTEMDGMVYPKEKLSIKGRSIIDHRFDHSNKLQQLTGGSFFTYSPGDLIPAPGKNEFLDLRIISAAPLIKLISDLKKEYVSIKEIEEQNLTQADASPDKKGEDIDEIQDKVNKFYDRLNIAEFFILTTKCKVNSKLLSPTDSMEIPKILGALRRNVEPFHYGQFTPKTGYLLFDITAPFGNILNPEYAYRKFPDIDEDFFNFILESEHSLLGKILCSSADDRKYIEHKEKKRWEEMHRLLSDSVIRNAEVLSTIRSNMIIKRGQSHDGSWKYLFSFYGNILDSGMRTQKPSEKSDPDEIAFNFLKPLDSLLQEIKYGWIYENPKSKEEDKEKGKDKEDIERCILIWNTFKSIFNSRSMVQEKEEKDKIDQVADAVKMPSVKEIMNVVKKTTTPSGIRKKLKEIDYFSKMSDEKLKEIIPDLPEGKKYTPKDVKAIIEEWYKKESERNTAHKTDSTNENTMQVYKNQHLPTPDKKLADNPIVPEKPNDAASEPAKEDGGESTVEK